MGDTKAVYCIERDGTTFSLIPSSYADSRSSHILKASGRLNFIRPVQASDAFWIARHNLAILLKFILFGPFTLIEQDERYSFEPSGDEWKVKCKDGVFELKETEVLDVALNNFNIKEILSTKKAIGLVGEESKRALSILSEMLIKDVFDKKMFEEVKRYAENMNDERVKDMLMIVQKRFRKAQNSKGSEVVIRIIE
jgi:hypothetical protein